MNLRRFGVAALAAGSSLFSLTGCATTPACNAPSLGELEHRGKRYALRELMDQNYHDVGKDPFRRNFNPDTMWADRSAIDEQMPLAHAEMLQARP